MKNLNKKISAVVLAGMIVAGGFASSGLRVHADEISAEDIKKYKAEKYDGELPSVSYAYGASLVPLSNDDNDPEVKKVIDEIDKVLKSKGFRLIRASSEFREDYEYYEPKRGIGAYLDGLEEIIGQLEGGKEFLAGPQLCFDNLHDFKRYINEKSYKIKHGMYRVQVGGIGVIFRYGRPSWAGR